MQCNIRHLHRKNGVLYRRAIRWRRTRLVYGHRAITMVGYSADGRYLYMGVSAGGTNLIALSQWLKNQGAHEVLKLIGGSAPCIAAEQRYCPARIG